ncbi:MAG TPA: CoA-binding protein, partial [Terriglobales bacterium]|nr:CoA-binding protein [Terriglobales bacterium]
MSSPDKIGELLVNSKTIAVVGLSSDPTRPSFGVSQYMQRKGYRIIPVNPNERTVLGEKAYHSL